MQHIGGILSGERPATRRACRRYRRNARFVADPKAWSRPIDRNTRSKILYLAEQLERRTKRPGCPNGCLGAVGLILLRALILGFANRKTGLCFPSYSTLQAKTGLCRQSIANGIKRLEAVGIVEVVRRLVRESIERLSPVTGQPETIVGTLQATNLYRFLEINVDRTCEFASLVYAVEGRKLVGSLRELFNAMVSRKEKNQYEVDELRKAI